MKYMVHNNGRIFSFVTNKYLKLQVDKDGYHIVKMAGKQQKVSRLVLLTFVSSAPRGKPYALHRDGNRQNNSIKNLYWGSQKDNMRDCLMHGNRPSFSGTRNGSAKLTYADVAKIRILRDHGHVLSDIAGRFSVSISAIHKIVMGKTWKN